LSASKEFSEGGSPYVRTLPSPASLRYASGGGGRGGGGGCGGGRGGGGGGGGGVTHAREGGASAIAGAGAVAGSARVASASMHEDHHGASPFPQVRGPARRAAPRPEGTASREVAISRQEANDLRAELEQLRTALEAEGKFPTGAATGMRQPSVAEVRESLLTPQSAALGSALGSSSSQPGSSSSQSLHGGGAPGARGGGGGGGQGAR
jgi:hypothetical protein